MAEVDEFKKTYTDISRGITHWQKIKLGDLTKDVRDRIDAIDLTVHELMELAIATMRKINTHVASGSGEEIEDSEVWPI